MNSSRTATSSAITADGLVREFDGVTAVVELGRLIHIGDTQYLEEADELADRVGIINDGRLVAQGSPDELKRNVGNNVIAARVHGTASSAARAANSAAGSTRSRRGTR